MTHAQLAMATLLGACWLAPAPAAHALSMPTPLHEVFEGDSLRVVVDAPTSSITTADRLTLTFTLSVGPGYSAPTMKIGDRLGPFTVVEQKSSGPAVTPQFTRVVHTLVLEPFLPGDYEIPPIEVLSVPVAPEPGARAGEKFQSLSVTTAPITVEVASVLKNAAEEADVAGIKPIAAAPVNWRPIIAGAGAGALALGALGVALVVVARRRANRPAPPPPPSHEVALARLRELRSRNLIQNGEHKVFFAEVSDILRAYIEERFGLMAPERTTEEFLREAATTGWFDADEVRTLRRFLTSCDLVKFADQRPAPEDGDRTADIAQSFIERTRPAPLPPGAPAPAPAEAHA